MREGRRGREKEAGGEHNIHHLIVEATTLFPTMEGLCLLLLSKVSWDKQSQRSLKIWAWLQQSSAGTGWSFSQWRESYSGFFHALFKPTEQWAYQLAETLCWLSSLRELHISEWLHVIIRALGCQVESNTLNLSGTWNMEIHIRKYSTSFFYLPIQRILEQPALFPTITVGHWMCVRSCQSETQHVCLGTSGADREVNPLFNPSQSVSPQGVCWEQPWRLCQPSTLPPPSGCSTKGLIMHGHLGDAERCWKGWVFALLGANKDDNEWHKHTHSWKKAHTNGLSRSPHWWHMAR